MSLVRRWWPDAVLGALVAGFALGETTGRTLSWPWPALVIGLAVGLLRRAPLTALGLLWLLLAGHVSTGTPLLAAELAAALVAFGAARWGRVPTVWLSALSIGVLAAGWMFALARRFDLVATLLSAVLGPAELKALLGQTGATLGGLVLAPLVAVLAVFGLPWLLGMAIRSVVEARRSRALQHLAERHRVLAQHQARLERDNADREREIATLRGDQARLARDVHDVVGHSLAVILAQAESAAYLEDPEQVRATAARIAEAARRSLQDVRTVLDATRGRPAATGAPGSLTALVADVRETGREVDAQVVGSPQPLPPELETVAYRVTQEMLTNAVRHGDRRHPITLAQHWAPEHGATGWLRIEVGNDSPEPAAANDTGGHGIDGMRRRLASVGGRLEIGQAAGRFTATAWLPIRAVPR